MAKAKKKSKSKAKAKTKSKAAAAKRAPAKRAPGKKGPAKKAPSKKKAAKKSQPKAAPAETLMVPADLDARLMDLAEKMELTFDAVLLQALCEFADAWEDHFRTVAALAEDDDRVQLAVKLD